MRRMAKLALSVWIGVVVSIALFTLFWRIGYLRPHVFWGFLSSAAIVVPTVWLVAAALRRCLRGPGRIRAVGWLLVGLTPLVWVGAYLAYLSTQVYASPLDLRFVNAPVRVAGVWLSWMMDVDAWWHYPRWTRGRHTVLMDDGRTPSVEKIVGEMDRHIQTMADRLGQPVPNLILPWVRGSLFGFHARAVYVWAMCQQEQYPGELTNLDRHEMAHTLITGLCGPDHLSPTVLIEGWAESQSCNRDDMIRDLARQRKDGRTISLQALVDPVYYGWDSGPVYGEGGPLVIYLMEHYGPKTFFRLYSGVRPDRFHQDCEAILGKSWAAVEADFWKWIEAEGKRLAPIPAPASAPATRPAVPAARVELAKSVKPADWQALVEGYRKANPTPEPLPSNAAFVFEGETVRKDAGNSGSPQRTPCEFRAIFEGDRFWIFENLEESRDRFLMGGPVHDPRLPRRDYRLEAGMRDKALDVLNFYRAEAIPSHFLPLREGSPRQGTYRIDRLVRPTKSGTGTWTVWYRHQFDKTDAEGHYRLELAPEYRWWITRAVHERKGSGRYYEMDAEYRRFGDVLMPAVCHVRMTNAQGEATAWRRARAMSQMERWKLKWRVELSTRLGLVGPYRWLRLLLTAASVVCPLVGMMLLGLTRRGRPTRDAS